jgi:hypothetical protein
MPLRLQVNKYLKICYRHHQCHNNQITQWLFNMPSIQNLYRVIFSKFLNKLHHMLNFLRPEFEEWTKLCAIQT